MPIQFIKRNYKSIARLLTAIFILSFLVWVIFSYQQEIDPRFLKAKLQSFGALAPLFFILFFIIGVVLAVPGVILAMTGGIMFGPVLGFTYNMIGTIIGCAIAFLISRHVISDWIARKIGPKMRIIINGINVEGWRFIALLRLSPIVPFNLLNYALGVTDIRFRTYLTTSAICVIPGCMAYTYLGALGVATAGNEEKLVAKALFGLFLLALASYSPRLLKLVKGRAS